MTLSRRRQGAGAASRQREDDESWSLGGLTPPTHHLRRRSQLSLAALLCVLALSRVPVSSASIVLTVSVAAKKKSVSEQRERDENLETNLPLSLASSSLSISPLFFPSIALTPPPRNHPLPSLQPLHQQNNQTTERQRHLRRHPGHAGGLRASTPPGRARGPARRRHPARRLRAAGRRRAAGAAVARGRSRRGHVDSSDREVATAAAAERGSKGGPRRVCVRHGQGLAPEESLAAAADTQLGPPSAVASLLL